MPEQTTRRARWAVPVAAAMLAGLVHVIVMALTHSWPLGNRDRGLGDYAPQYLPFHVAYSQALHGSDLVSWRFNWTAGGGVASLPDYATYLASPFSLLVALAPPDRVELALAWMIVVKLMVAAAAMTLLLTRLTGHHHYAAAALGAAYACSSWVFDQSLSTPMWLDGLIGFPLLCLVALWCQSMRRIVPGVAVVALVWWSNYYTAFMASLGAAWFLVTWLVCRQASWAAARRTVVRFALTGLLGVLATGVILVPTVLAVRAGVPIAGTSLQRLPWREYWVRLFPVTEGVARTPAISCGSLVLVLVLSLVWSRLPRRQALPWLVGVLACLASGQVPFLLRVWNVFDSPNGNPYRFSFVVCGLLVVAAWIALHEGSLATTTQLSWPRVPGLVTGLLVIAVLALALGRVSVRLLWVDRWGLGFSVLVAVGALAVALVRQRRRPLAMALLVLAVVVETIWAACFVADHVRLYTGASYRGPGAVATRLPAAQAVTEQAGWAGRRVGGHASTPSQMWFDFNAGQLLHYPAISYYSSVSSKAMADSWRLLGVYSRNDGRMLLDVPDPGLDPLSAVAVRPVDADYSSTRSARVLPMVRQLAGPTGSTTNIFANRNQLAGAEVYTRAAGVRLTGTQGEFQFDPVVPAHGTGRFSARCEAGQVLQFVMPKTALATLSWQGPNGIQRVPTQGRSLVALSPAPTGEVTIATAGDWLTVGTRSFHCLDLALLDRQVRAVATPTTTIEPGRVRAEFAQPVAGQVVLATASQPGWRCEVDGTKRVTGTVGGLLSVAGNKGRVVECTFTSPGLVAGWITTLAGLALAGLWRWSARPRRSVPASRATRTSGTAGATRASVAAGATRVGGAAGTARATAARALSSLRRWRPRGR